MNVVSLAVEGDGARSDAALRWDAYVGPRALAVTDLWSWRLVVRDAYGMRSHFLAAERDGVMVGALGLYEVRHPIFGHHLTTAPFGNDGGLHFDDNDDEARDALLAEAKALADRLGVPYLVIRSRAHELPTFVVDRHYRSATLDLSPGPTALWDALPAKTRNQVRRGMKEGFSLEAGASQEAAFIDVLHHHMRDLGSPVHGLRYYDAIAKHLPDQHEVLVMRDGTRLVAGALLLWSNGVAMNIHTVSLREFNTRCPNYLLYWRMMERSAERGCRLFDMGRSEEGSPNLRFKSNWGPTEVTLHYNFYLRGLAEPPYVDPRNPKYRLPILAWRMLPVAITRLIGPRLMGGLA